jgi:hypothetical protein
MGVVCYRVRGHVVIDPVSVAPSLLVVGTDAQKERFLQQRDVFNRHDGRCTLNNKRHLE